MIILSICVSPLHDIHPRMPEASPLRNETHRRLLRLKRFTYTINLDHYRSLLGTNSPGSDGAQATQANMELLIARAHEPFWMRFRGDSYPHITALQR